MKLLSQITPTTAAWVAGIFDTGGTIYVMKDAKDRYCLSVKVCRFDAEISNHLRSLFGGSVTKTDKDGEVDHMWTLRKLDSIKRLLVAIEPFIVNVMTSRKVELGLLWIRRVEEFRAEQKDLYNRMAVWNMLGNTRLRRRQKRKDAAHVNPAEAKANAT